jgi:flavin-dependent dehydrogenase
MAREPLLIVGGGLAGAAAALALAKAGHRPLLIERERAARDKVCGCFLSGEAVAMLARLGVDLDRLGASHIDRLRLFHEQRAVEAHLPFRARGLSRGRLDGALLEQAAAAGVRIRFGTAVTAIAGDAEGTTVSLRDGGHIAARALFLATGKHDVRGASRPLGPAPAYIGFRQSFRLTPTQTERLRGAIELHLFDGGYAGLQSIEQDKANLCLIVEQGAFQACGGTWDALLRRLMGGLPRLAERLADAEPAAAAPLAISAIPYGYIHRPGAAASSVLYRLGDQAAVIPSFAGDGMAIALHTGLAAAACHMASGSATAYHAALRATLMRQFVVAGALHRLAKQRWGRCAILATGALSPAALGWAARATRLRATGGQ